MSVSQAAVAAAFGKGFGYVAKTKTRSGFDPKLAQAQLQALQQQFKSFGVSGFCWMFIMVLAKKEMLQTNAGQVQTNRRLVPYYLNKIQQDLTKTMALRNITVKPRQIGLTTWEILVRLLLPAILEPGTSGMLISQTHTYAAQHFGILKRADKHFGQNAMQLSADPQLATLAQELQQHVLHKQYSARREVQYDFLDSKVICESAENPEAGQGVTIQRGVGTETARWPGNPEETLANMKEAIPAEGTLDLDSTPNGFGGYFFEEWKRAKNWPQAEFKPHFYPWWWQDEYQEEPGIDKRTLTEEEQRMAKEFHWTMKQVQWRRGKQRSLRHNFAEKYAEDDETCFLTSGQLFFDKDSLVWLKRKLMTEKPIQTFHEGALKIYKRRVKGRRYLLAGDVAEGKLVSTDNSDFNSAVVIDIDTGEEMAAYRRRIPPEDAAQDWADLGAEYNNAVIAPERNGPGGSVILTLQRHLLYGNIYEHKEWYRERKQVIAVPGFPTNLRTRPIALNKLAAMLRDAPELWHDEGAIDQALNFVWVTRKTGSAAMGSRRPEGGVGCHDDDVMCRAIAAYCRLVLLGYLDPVETPSERYGDTGAEEEQDLIA